MRIDLFCKVIDNFGDAGVCWRLARQLAGEYGAKVRFWIDLPECLQRLRRADVTAPEIEICAWTPQWQGVEPRDVVIEAFGCPLPEAYVAAMAGRERPPLWINLEYLSAEPWVEGCHALPSPHPRLPLTKYFFFPGFSRRTGGLSRERDLDRQRSAYLADPDAAADFRRRLGLPESRTGPMCVSLFCYRNPALSSLLQTWIEGRTEILCVVPQAAVPDLEVLGLSDRVGAETRKGSLSLRVIPFLDQDDYDRLLWSCDFNFVRGEDSFLRAQWAALPFVWQAYPQDKAAHHAKVAAFLERFLAGLDEAPAAAMRDFFAAWNGMPTPHAAGEAWSRLLPCMETLKAHGESWNRELGSMPSLAAGLASFIDSKLK